MDDVELFIGQMIALLPKLPASPADPALRRQLRLLFPQAGLNPVAPSATPSRPRTYSLITNSKGGGTLIAGGSEIEVAVLPLDVGTPSEASAFRVVAIAGRALRVRGVAERGDRVNNW